MVTLRRLARSLDAVAAKLGRLAALLDAWAETGEAVERKHERPPCRYGCGRQSVFTDAGMCLKCHGARLSPRRWS